MSGAPKQLQRRLRIISLRCKDLLTTDVTHRLRFWPEDNRLITLYASLPKRKGSEKKSWLHCSAVQQFLDYMVREFIGATASHRPWPALQCLTRHYLPEEACSECNSAARECPLFSNHRRVDRLV